MRKFSQATSTKVSWRALSVTLSPQLVSSTSTKTVTSLPLTQNRRNSVAGKPCKRLTREVQILLTRTAKITTRRVRPKATHRTERRRRAPHALSGLIITPKLS